MALPRATSKDDLGALTQIGVPGDKVADEAFLGAVTLELADLRFQGSKIKEIGSFAFANCVSLEVVACYVGNVKIGPYAFQNCRSLHNAKFSGPDDRYTQGVHFNVENIEEGAFKGCRSLESVAGKIGVIGESAFQDCSALERCRVDDLTQIGEYAFRGCGSLRLVTLPADVGQYAFRKCTSLSSVRIPSAAKIIRTGTFKDCYALAMLEGADSVETIEDEAFSNCALLGSVNTGAENIGKWAFANCIKLVEVIARNVKTIHQQTFEGCSSLSKLITPSVNAIKQYAFAGCTELAEVDIANAELIQRCAFRGCGLKALVLSKVIFIGIGAFELCEKLETLVIRSERVKIRQSAFKGCSSLTSVVIESDFVEIEPRAFRGCTSLKKVTVPGNSVIHSTAFQGSSVEKLVVLGKKGQLKSHSRKNIESEEEEVVVEGNYSAKDDPLKIMGWTAATHEVLPENDKDKARILLLSLNRTRELNLLPSMPQEMRQMTFKPQPSDVYTITTQRLNDRVAPE